MSSASGHLVVAFSLNPVKATEDKISGQINGQLQKAGQSFCDGAADLARSVFTFAVKPSTVTLTDFQGYYNVVFTVAILSVVALFLCASIMGAMRGDSRVVVRAVAATVTAVIGSVIALSLLQMTLLASDGISEAFQPTPQLVHNGQGVATGTDVDGDGVTDPVGIPVITNHTPQPYDVTVNGKRFQGSAIMPAGLDTNGDGKVDGWGTTVSVVPQEAQASGLAGKVLDDLRNSGFLHGQVVPVDTNDDGTDDTFGILVDTDHDPDHGSNAVMTLDEADHAFDNVMVDVDGDHKIDGVVTYDGNKITGVSFNLRGNHTDRPGAMPLGLSFLKHVRELGDQGNEALDIVLSLLVMVFSVLMFITVIARPLVIALAAVFVPLYLAGQGSLSTSSWMKRGTSLLLAFIVTKPVTTLTFSIGTRLISAVVGTDPLLSILGGIALMAVAIGCPFIVMFLFGLAEVHMVRVVSNLTRGRSASYGYGAGTALGGTTRETFRGIGNRLQSRQRTVTSLDGATVASAGQLVPAGSLSVGRMRRAIGAGVSATANANATARSSADAAAHGGIGATAGLAGTGARSGPVALPRVGATGATGAAGVGVGAAGASDVRAARASIVPVRPPVGAAGRPNAVSGPAGVARSTAVTRNSTSSAGGSAAGGGGAAAGGGGHAGTGAARPAAPRAQAPTTPRAPAPRVQASRVQAPRPQPAPPAPPPAQPPRAQVARPQASTAPRVPTGPRPRAGSGSDAPSAETAPPARRPKPPPTPERARTAPRPPARPSGGSGGGGD